VQIQVQNSHQRRDHSAKHRSRIRFITERIPSIERLHRIAQKELKTN
jgi:hypothetical protein